MPSQNNTKKLKVFFIFIDAANSQISLNPEKKEKNIRANKRLLFPAFSAITVHVFQSILSNHPR